MNTSETLLERADHTCELCTASSPLVIYKVENATGEDANIVVCQNCSSQLHGTSPIEVNHWRCLNDSMWSEVPAVQVVAYRMLYKLREEGWPQDLLELMYLPEELIPWAKSGVSLTESTTPEVKHLDSNGVQLLAGDSVVLIKDLKVKGASFIAKRGTSVRNISLVHDNPSHIEGKVNDQHIVILTQYVKK
ncbi:MAG: PhnA domain-containing protein [Cyclobacteriaceae bacterium]